jgi:hypothetical protein
MPWILKKTSENVAQKALCLQMKLMIGYVQEMREGYREVVAEKVEPRSAHRQNEA